MDTPRRQRRRAGGYASVPLPEATRTPLAQLATRTPLAQLATNTPARPPAPTSAVKTLRLAFQDTPSPLRELEAAWRARRSARMDEPARPLAPSSHAPVSRGVTGPAGLAARRVRFGAWSDDGTPVPSDMNFAVSPLGSETPSPLPAPVPTAAPTQTVAPPQPVARGFPPTPPSSPPPPRAKASRPPRDRPPGDTAPARRARTAPADDPLTPAPLTSRRLPPTNLPIALSAPGDTLTVNSADHSTSLVFSLGGGRTRVRVSRDGCAAAVSALRGGARARFTLRLGESAAWSGLERRMWGKLGEMLRAAEAKTPRVKLFTAAGDIAITCSDPPDIILSFAIRPPTDDSLVPDAPPSTRSKTRLRYSRREGLLAIDTASRGGGGGGGSGGANTLRTSRTVSLGDVDDASGPRHPRALGIAVGDDWSELEREAVRRFVALRAEWEAAGAASRAILS